MRFQSKLIYLAISTGIGLFMTAHAISEVKRIKGQTVYVPIYSHIYHGYNEKHPIYLTSTLSIRNTDPDYPIVITVIDYYDTDGNRIRSYLKNPLKLNAMASTRVIIQESEKIGGSGANYVVKWESEHDVTEPMIESIMIGTKSQQGISFTSRGQVIREIK